ncbi:MAG: hypothetical protein R3324_10335, partial [Halobacteriales archaeon]|nr:hypothetical protein [Halobacteriales archaeon]
AFDLSNEELTRFKQYRAFLRNTAGSKEMNVDGSVTPVDFRVVAEVGKVKWVAGARFIINGTNFEMVSQDLKRFGSATSGGGSLPNGLAFFSDQGGVLTNIFLDPVRQTVDFLNYNDDFTNFVNAITSQSDFLSFDFFFEQPVVLAPGSVDELVVRVQDDLTALDQLRVIVRGYQELSVT